MKTHDLSLRAAALLVACSSDDDDSGAGCGPDINTVPGLITIDPT